MVRLEYYYTVTIISKFCFIGAMKPFTRIKICHRNTWNVRFCLTENREMLHVFSCYYYYITFREYRRTGHNALVFYDDFRHLQIIFIMPSLFIALPSLLKLPTSVITDLYGPCVSSNLILGNSKKLHFYNYCMLPYFILGNSKMF